MSELADKRCKPCEGSVAAFSAEEARRMRSSLESAWQLSDDTRSIRREWRFKDFYRTMSFVNAVAHVANIEDHHPDLQVGYGSCRVTYSTHAIKGLSENDFICAAKLDRIPTA